MTKIDRTNIEIKALACEQLIEEACSADLGAGRFGNFQREVLTLENMEQLRAEARSHRLSLFLADSFVTLIKGIKTLGDSL